MKDRVPKYPGRVKLVPVTGQENTFDMLRADEPTQPGDPLNKATFLTDATAAMLGLDENAVPNDALAFLGKYNLHWWKRTAQETATKYRYAQTQEGGQITVYYEKCLCSDAVVLNEDTGVLELVNPTPVYTYADFISHPYCKSTGQGVYINAGGNYSYNETDVFYCPNKPNNSGSGWVRYDSNNPVYKLVVASYEVAVGESEFVHSSDRNAYPDSGISNGFEYAYLGIPFDNAVTAPKIETGSYTGTGKAGSSNKNSLTFSVDPKFVFIGSASHVGGIFYAKGMSGTLTFMPDLGAGMNFSLSGKTLTWYNLGAKANSTNATDVALQLNSSGETYHYVAIG